jgi:hypothetical protein
MKRRVPVVLLLVLAVFLVEAVFLLGYTLDDAFISFRYARNAVRGEGLVYNPGERVEGYSNFLWTLLFIPVIALRLDPEHVSWILGILFALGTLVLTFRLSEHVGKDRKLRWIAPLLLALHPAFAMQAISGLETHLFGFLFLTGVYLTLKENDRRRVFPWSAAAFLGCALTRPEGAVLFAGSIVFAVFSRRISKNAEGDSLPPLLRGVRGDPVTRWALSSALLFGAGYLIYQAWRISYYGSLFPNTYYVKVSGLSQVKMGWNYLLGFLDSWGGILFPAIVLAGVLASRRRFAAIYLGLFSAGFPAMVVYEGGDWMPLHRLFVPVMPILAVLFTEGAITLTEGLNAWISGLKIPSGRLRAGGVVLAAFIALPAVESLTSLPPMAEQAKDRAALYERAHRSLGRWLKGASGGELIALTDIGQIGYYADVPVLDMVGLVDPTIGRAPGLLHEKIFDPNYVIDRRPAFVVLVTQKQGKSWTNGGFSADLILLNNLRFRAEYPGSVLVHYKDDYSYWVCPRRDKVVETERDFNQPLRPW